jgi:hypothetical protein
LTEFIITNITGAPVTCRLTFWQDNGAPLSLSLNGANATSSYVVQIPGHSTQFLSTPGAGASVTGWALADNAQKLGVIAAYRLQVSNRPESEATVEGIPATGGFAMAFDETPGFDTGFALANGKHQMNTTWRELAGRRYWRHVEDTSGAARLLAAAHREATTDRDAGASVLPTAPDQRI